MFWLTWDALLVQKKKEVYLNKVKQAGFQQIEVVAEDYLPEMMFNEPDIKAFVEEQKLTRQEIDEISDAIVSIKVSALKP
jgi:hypothetical protein